MVYNLNIHNFIYLINYTSIKLGGWKGHKYNLFIQLKTDTLDYNICTYIFIFIFMYLIHNYFKIHIYNFTRIELSLITIFISATD